MKRTFLLLLCFLIFLSAKAQFRNNVYDGLPLDSATISFDQNLPGRSSTNIQLRIDSSTSAIWQIGITQKAFFASDSTRKAGIMTDTANPYPINANDWFVVTFRSFSLNPIVSFTHKYETRLAHDGGIVEYSFDSTTWNNVVGGCFQRVLTDTFYTAADTLPGNIPAFSGTKDWQRSRFQIFQGLPLKPAGSCYPNSKIYVRFRFVSDTIPDTLAGWMIRNVTIERDYYNGAVSNIENYPSLNVHPNPSMDGFFNWPDFIGSEKSKIYIIDLTGKIIKRSSYVRLLDCSALNPGIYFYRASSENGDYSGKLIRE